MVVHIPGRDAGAFFGESQRGSATNSGNGAGYEYYLIFESGFSHENWLASLRRPEGRRLWIGKVD